MIENIEIDLARYESTFRSIRSNIDLKDAVRPVGENILGKTITKNIGRLYLKRLFKILIMTKNASRIDNIFYANAYIEIINATPIDLLLKFSASPQVTGFFYKSVGFGDSEAPVHLLGVSMLDLAISGKSNFRGKIPLLFSQRSKIELPLCGKWISIPGIRPGAECTVSLSENELQFSDGINKFRLNLDSFVNCMECELNDIFVGQLPRIHNTTINLVCDDALLFYLSPQDPASRAATVRDDLIPLEIQQYLKAFDGISLVKTAWPEGYIEIVDAIHSIMPLKHDGTMHPRNHSVHSLRGLVASAPRPTHLAAQMWAHESGHNRMSSIFDLFNILHPDCVKYVHSSFVEEQRPPQALLHGAFSFVRDLEITRRLIDQRSDVPHQNMLKYFHGNLHRLNVAMDTIMRELKFTARGSELITGFEVAVESLNKW